MFYVITFDMHTHTHTHMVKCRVEKLKTFRVMNVFIILIFQKLAHVCNSQDIHCRKLEYKLIQPQSFLFPLASLPAPHPQISFPSPQRLPPCFFPLFCFTLSIMYTLSCKRNHVVVKLLWWLFYGYLYWNMSDDTLVECHTRHTSLSISWFPLYEKLKIWIKKNYIYISRRIDLLEKGRGLRGKEERRT